MRRISSFVQSIRAKILAARSVSALGQVEAPVLSVSLFCDQSFADLSRTPPAALKATDAEAAQLYRTMGAYAGRYKADGDKLIVTPEVASSPALVGTEQTYMIEIKGDRYQLNTAPTFSKIFGTQVVTTVVTERVK
jgi:Lipocalin-like domain